MLIKEKFSSYLATNNIEANKHKLTLFFDLDGTLVYTDKVNTLAYQYALQRIVGKDYQPTLARITRNELKNHLDTKSLQEVIRLKCQIYNELVGETTINHEVVELLKEYRQPCQCYLITASHKNRAEITLKHHGLDKLVSKKFFCAGVKNKYQYALKKLCIDGNLTFVFENELSEAFKASSAGIPKKHIYLVT